MFTAKRKGILALLISVMAAALLAFGVFFALPSTTASAAEGEEQEISSKDVADWKSMVTAVNDSSIDKVVMTSDIEFDFIYNEELKSLMSSGDAAKAQP